MEVNNMGRWFVELVVHKHHLPSQDELDKYHIVDSGFAVESHELIGCLLTKKSKLDYWKTRLADLHDEKGYWTSYKQFLANTNNLDDDTAKAIDLLSDHSSGIKHCNTVMAKIIRGIY